ncbi:MAG: RHS repeat-associated core domain-containing protein, partial [Wenzhouxiangellaceae bacterium]
VQTYNVAGNMLTKTGLGTYTYGSTRPHAVTAAGGVTYTYDANGNVTSDTSGRAFHYTGYDLVRRVSQGTAHTEFHYDAGRSRTLKRELSGTTVTSRTHYLGSVEVIWNGSNPTTSTGQYRRTIGGVLIATFYQSTGVTQQRYLHRDHLGSIVAISDEAGQVVTWMAFDPWGQRRNADAWHPWNAPPSVYLNAMLAITPRGFTGHEHVDSAGIIHMNGRIYDPNLGRFLQADPFVEDTSTLNRYTYVHNNLLAYTDPSGYFSLKKIFKLAAVIGLSIVTYGAAAAYFGTLTTSTLLIKTAAGAVAGFVSGGVATGTLEGAYLGALGGAIMGAAAGVNWSGSISRTLGTATAGGVQSSLTGGKFGHGFLSAGITSAASPALARVPDGGRIIANAVVGGTVSRITGGKFSNGAMTAAMSYAFSSAFDAGRKPTTQERTYARLADGVYDPEFQGVDGYVKSGDTFIDQDTGLQSALFVNGETGHSVLAFAGTNGKGDWAANIGQAFGGDTAQYRQALRQAGVVYKNTGGNVHFVGHSLGGGLAAASAIVTGGSATVFNAAGVHRNTVGGLVPTPGSITHFRSSFDILQPANALTPARIHGQQVSLGVAGWHPMGGVCRAMGC